MAVKEVKVSVTTTGADASGAGSASSDGISGFLLDVYLDYHASAPGTTDIVISDAKHSDAILTVTDNATDGRYAPRYQACDEAAADISGGYEMFPLNNGVTVTVAGANALTDCVVAYIRYLEA